MGAPAFLRLLKRDPLGYKETARSGSHRKLESPNGYPDLRFSFHDKTEVGGTMIKEVLVGQVGLDESEALAILRG
jgi:predicted RNA binding protein YcfA (HicA-like mRNA interferase family)